MADYPNVPQVPGVPALIRDPYAAPAALPVLLSGDGGFGYGSNLIPAWGIYTSRGSSPVIIADTITEFEFKREWAIADYPVEGGGFESYDKVDIPFSAQVTFVSGGDEATRQELLDSIDAIAGTLTRFDVVTPEKNYLSVNVQHYHYRRAARNNLGIMMVTVWLLEIREQGVSTQNAASPSGNSFVNAGPIGPFPNAAPTDQTVQQIASTTNGGVNGFSLSQFPQVPATFNERFGTNITVQ